MRDIFVPFGGNSVKKLTVRCGLSKNWEAAVAEATPSLHRNCRMEGSRPTAGFCKPLDL